jgi:hypothetical protein
VAEDLREKVARAIFVSMPWGAPDGAARDEFWDRTPIATHREAWPEGFIAADAVLAEVDSDGLRAQIDAWVKIAQDYDTAQRDLMAERAALRSKVDDLGRALAERNNEEALGLAALRAGVEALHRLAESRRWAIFEGTAEGSVQESEIRALLAAPTPEAGQCRHPWALERGDGSWCTTCKERIAERAPTPTPEPDRGWQDPVADLRRARAAAEAGPQHPPIDEVRPADHEGHEYAQTCTTHGVVWPCTGGDRG